MHTIRWNGRATLICKAIKVPNHRLRTMAKRQSTIRTAICGHQFGRTGQRAIKVCFGNFRPTDQSDGFIL